MSDELAPLGDRDGHLISTNGGSSAQGPGKKRSFLRRTAGRLVDILGDSATAWRGKQAEDLRQNLKDLGRELSGGSSTTKRESDTLSRDQQGNANRASSNVYLLWLVFSERVAASRELLGKVPEIMAPPGWALVVSSPTDRAEELLNALSTIFRDQDAWKRTLSSAKGYLADVKREAERLRLIKDEQLGDDKQTQRTALKKIVSTADTTLADLTRTLEKLVVAAPAFEEVPRPPLASR